MCKALVVSRPQVLYLSPCRYLSNFLSRRRKATIQTKRPAAKSQTFCNIHVPDRTTGTIQGLPRATEREKLHVADRLLQHDKLITCLNKRGARNIQKGFSFRYSPSARLEVSKTCPIAIANLEREYKGSPRYLHLGRNPAFTCT